MLPVEGSPRLQRAMSCDSVSSDSSLVDIESDVPRIGQLEFGIEYDRYGAAYAREGDQSLGMFNKHVRSFFDVPQLPDR